MHPHYPSRLFGFVSKLKVIRTSNKGIHFTNRIPSDINLPDTRGLEEAYPIIYNLAKTESYLNPPYHGQRITEYLEHNMENVSLTPLLAFMDFYRGFASVPLSQEDIKLGYIMAWCAEVMRSIICVTDDATDNSPIRKSRPAWHRVGDNDKLMAFNDSLMVEQYVYELLKAHYRDKSYYLDVVDTFRHTLHAYVAEQYFEVWLRKQFLKTRDFSIYTDPDTFSKFLEYRDTPTVWYISVFTSMKMNNIKNPELYHKMERAIAEISHVYAALDDYMDCYAPRQGKIGDDIENGACSWLIVNAVKMANSQQKSILRECYGIPEKEKVEAVVKVFDELDMKSFFKQYSEKAKRDMEKTIQELPDVVPKEAFMNILKRAYYTRM